MLVLSSLPKIKMQIVMRLVTVLWIIREPGGIKGVRSVIWTESTTPWLVRQLQEFTGTRTIEHQFALNWSRLKYNPSDKSVYYGVNIDLSAEFSSNGTILSLAELKGQIQSPEESLSSDCDLLYLHAEYHSTQRVCLDWLCKVINEIVEDFSEIL